VDNPETHLELTMVHEAMILEQTGTKLALMELFLRHQAVDFVALLINIFFRGDDKRRVANRNYDIDSRFLSLKACILGNIGRFIRVFFDQDTLFPPADSLWWLCFYPLLP
jgi:formate hydrogenlyase subunit 4